MFKKLIYSIFLLCFLALAFVAYQFFAKPLLKNPPAVSIIIQPGTGLNAIAQQLHHDGLMPYPTLFIAWALLNHQERLLKAGEYEIDTSMTAAQFLNNMVAGKVILHKVTFIEGWTFQDMRQALDQNPFLTHTITKVDDKELMKSLGSKLKSPEGLFFPETYTFTRGDKDTQVLQESYKRMQDMLNFQWEQRAPNLPYPGSYQALIVASMIEKEAASSPDRVQISGVILRRLKKGMRLQIDDTLFYGLHQPQTYHLTKADLQKDTPYNTYLHYALPPTPICMPSEESIYAALHPDSGDSLYYVARGDGGSEFSSTYEKHQKAVAQFIIK